MIVDMASLGKVNIWRLQSGEFCTRPGLRRIYAPDNGRIFVGGFTIQQAFTGETWQYLLHAATSGMRDLKLRIVDENMVTFQEYSYNLNIIPRGFSYARVNGQLLIGSPDLPTLWGLEGSGVIPALKKPSISGSDVIDVPSGLITSWQNRPVICFGPSMAIGDPVNVQGGDLRSFIGDNQNLRPGAIYGIHEAAGGMLVAVTSEGIYGLDAGAAAVGVVGTNGSDWRILSHHRAWSYESSAVVRGRLFALSRGGIIVGDTEDGQELLLSQPPMPRAFGTRIVAEDYRTARILPGDEGPIVGLDTEDAVWVIDRRTGLASWWTVDPAVFGSFRVRALLRDVDGTQMLLTEDGILRLEGDFDGEVALAGGQPVTKMGGVLMGRVEPEDTDNVLVNQIRVRAAVGGSGGGSLAAAVRGKAHAKPGNADMDGLTVGVSAWGAAGRRFVSTPISSVEFQFGQNDAKSGRDPTFEVSVQGCGVRIDAPSVNATDSAAQRPLKVG